MGSPQIVETEQGSFQQLEPPSCPCSRGSWFATRNLNNYEKVGVVIYTFLTAWKTNLGLPFTLCTQGLGMDRAVELTIFFIPQSSSYEEISAEIQDNYRQGSSRNLLWSGIPASWCCCCYSLHNYKQWSWSPCWDSVLNLSICLSTLYPFLTWRLSLSMIPDSFFWRSFEYSPINDSVPRH